MMRPTALDHVSADLAWHHRNYGTDGDRATRRAADRLRGTTKAAAVSDFLLRGCQTRTRRAIARQPANRGIRTAVPDDAPERPRRAQRDPGGSAGSPGPA